MRVTVQMVHDWLDGLAPFATAEGYDNVGLLIGQGSAPAGRILFCVDATYEAVQEAVREKATLMVAHHPLMFSGIRRIAYDTPEGKILRAIMTAGLSLIAAHTNLDKAPGGIGESLAKAIGLAHAAPLGQFAWMGTLSQPLEAEAFGAHVGGCLGAPVRLYGECRGPIAQVAVSPGAGGDGIRDAVLAGAQAYVVGEIKHHELLEATAQGLPVLEAGHYATEAAGMKSLCEGFRTMAAGNGWSAVPLWFSQAPFPGALCR